jgi:hypothetical protein
MLSNYSESCFNSAVSFARRDIRLLILSARLAISSMKVWASGEVDSTIPSINESRKSFTLPSSLHSASNSALPGSLMCSPKPFCLAFFPVVGQARLRKCRPGRDRLLSLRRVLRMCIRGAQIPEPTLRVCGCSTAMSRKFDSGGGTTTTFSAVTVYPFRMSCSRS